MDTNAVGSSNTGASAEKIDAISQYAASDLFTPAEKAALRLAEAMSQTPAEISDEVFEGARHHFSEPQLVELVATAAMENYRARFNRAFGVESQGFYQPQRRSLTSTS
jgi:4-carboxymuconolactone decarboxylase